MAELTELQIDTDVDEVIDDFEDSVATEIPGWQPVPGAIEVIVARILLNLLVEARLLLTDVGTEIFRFYGETMYNIAKNEAIPAEVTSTWTARDSAGHTIEAGTVVVAQNAAGEEAAFEVVEEVEIAASDTATDAGEVELRAVVAGEAGNGYSGSAEATGAFSWIESIELVGTSANGADEEDQDDYDGRLVDELQLQSPRPILPDNAATIARRIDGVARAVAIDLFNPEHNLLSENAASVETNVSDWNATTNCAIAQSATHAASGSQSLRLSSSAGGDMLATQDSGLNGTPVEGGKQYTLSAYCRAGASARNFQIGVNWYDSGGSIIGSTVYGDEVAGTTANFTTLAFVTAVAPATAEYAAMVLRVEATAGASELHYFDRMQIRRGAVATPWAAGGTPADDNARTVAVGLMAEDGTAVPSLVAAEVVAELTAMREAGFLFYSIDPVETEVDVEYEITVQDGFDSAETLAAVDAALTEYLSPALWGLPASGDSSAWELTDTVELYEVVTIINNVGGVDRVTLLELDGSAADVTLPGVIPVANVGTITGSVA